MAISSDPLPTITIPKTVYDNLIKDRTFLRALQAAGVDNWEGYDEARRSLPDDEDDESAESIYGA